MLDVLGAREALAQDINVAAPLVADSVTTNVRTPLNVYFTQAPFDLGSMPTPEVSASAAPSGRPRALGPLYISFASLQALDVTNTLRALDRGAYEANPVVAPLVNSPAAFIAMKAGATAAVIYLTERLRKRHPVRAVFLMVGLNSAYAGILAHNHRIGTK